MSKFMRIKYCRLNAWPTAALGRKSPSTGTHPRTRREKNQKIHHQRSNRKNDEKNTNAHSGKKTHQLANYFCSSGLFCLTYSKKAGKSLVLLLLLLLLLAQSLAHSRRLRLVRSQSLSRRLALRTERGPIVRCGRGMHKM